MNSILEPVLAIAATILLLLLRELILSVGKKDRNSYGISGDQRPGISDLEREHSLRADPIMEFQEPLTQATPIAVDEFLAELRAKAEEQSPSSPTRTGSMTDFRRTQSRRKQIEG